jgi:TonB family protein
MLCALSLPISGAEEKTSTTPSKIDYSAYMESLSLQVKKHWAPLASSVNSTNVTVTWTIHQDGTISGLKIKNHASKDEERAALKAVREAAPFEPIPQGAGPFEVEFSFDLSGKPKPLGLTVNQALKKFGPDARKRLLPHFQQMHVSYPPKHVTLVCLKEEDLLFVVAKDDNDKWKQVRSYTLVSRSGVQGPKLKEGDLQVPEGFYKITALDAMTHLAMWVNYPNTTDRANAKLDHRTNIGGNIQIHAGIFSSGCMVLNNDDMAELLLLGHDTGCANIDLVVAPCNLVTKQPAVDFKKQPQWLPGLYKDLKQTLAGLPIEPPASKPQSPSKPK